MPEKVPNTEIEKKPAESAALPATPAKAKSKPVELILDEGDALFHKRSGVE